MGCSQVHYLGMKKHDFSKTPRRIFFFQIAGFDSSHIGLLKFANWESVPSPEFENFQCTAQVWNHNLFHIRPEAYEVFNAQSNGSLGHEGGCKGLESPPFWDYLNSKVKFSTVIIEQGASDSESLLRTRDCKDSNWLRNTLYISRGNQSKVKGMKDFFITHKSRINDTGILQDTSCNATGCFHSIEKLTMALKSRWEHSNGKFSYIFRNYSYAQFLKKSDIKAAAKVLAEISQTITYLKREYGSSDTLFLVSGAKSVHLDFPYQGKSWKNLAKSISSSKSNFLSPLFASGARAENFCGIYNSNKIFTRIFWGKKEKKFF